MDTGGGGEELGPFPSPTRLIAQVPLHRVNYSTDESLVSISKSHKIRACPDLITGQ